MTIMSTPIDKLTSSVLSSRPTAAEARIWPSFAAQLSEVIPPQYSGRTEVGSSRGTPCELSWQIHGQGSTKIVVSL